MNAMKYITFQNRERGQYSIPEQPRSQLSRRNLGDYEIPENVFRKCDIVTKDASKISVCNGLIDIRPLPMPEPPMIIKPVPLPALPIYSPGQPSDNLTEGATHIQTMVPQAQPSNAKLYAALALGVFFLLRGK